MVTLQEVFYPALAAVGLPCKYRINVSEELLVDLQHRSLSDHFEEKLHAVQVKFPLPDGNFCGRQPCPDLHRGP